jgi:hypothetical protein
VSIERNRVTTDDAKLAANPAGLPHFFQKVDWVSFGVTTLLALAVYLFTLSPEVDLDFSGFYSTAAMYPGVSISPGHPLWAIYGWLFIKLLPFSNIAWRLGVASAVAGALVCGLIALMVSRVGVLAAENISSFKNLLPNEEKSLRVVCSCVAGLGFGFDGCFWPKAVIPDPQPLGLLLFVLTLCFLTRWFFAPYQRRYLCAAAFTYGLTLANNQSLVTAAFGLPFLVAPGNRKVGREIFFAMGVFLWSIPATNRFLHWYDMYLPSTRHIFLLLCVIFSFTWSVLAVRTCGILSEWKTTSICAALFLVGLSAYFLLPVFSMTTPPMNWGYPRTVEGFFHVLNRGQFDTMNPTASFGRLITQLGIYGKIAVNEFGSIYLLVAVIPFLVLHKMAAPARKWLEGILVVWIFVSLLTLVGLNPGPDKASVELNNPFFAASHLILAVFAGCGLMLVGAFFGRPAAAESRC